MMLKDPCTETFLCEWCGEAVACHGNQTFYNSFIARDKVYKLGDVVYVRHVDDFERMTFLEIYMLWELKGEKYLSLRAYYFPEDTVEGRFPEQGQDEVLCLEGEVVMPCGEFLQHLDNTHSESKDLPELKILSFAGYCRCCAVRRRLGDLLHDYTSHPMFAALGGVDPRYRVLFCRETVHDKELHRLWKCQNLYRDVPDKKHSSKKNRLKLHSESNDDSSISDAGEILNKANGKTSHVNYLPTSCYSSTAGNAKVANSDQDKKDGRIHAKTVSEEDQVVNVEDPSVHSVTSSAAVPSHDHFRRSKLQCALSDRLVASLEDHEHSSLVNNVTNIKIPSNFLSSKTTPQQLDMIVKQLSQEMSSVTKTSGLSISQPFPENIAGWDNSSLVSNVTNIKLPSHLLSSQTTPQQLDIIVRQLSQLQDAKNTQRKLKYLMKQ